MQVIMADINYVQAGSEKARYHANDSSLDTVIIAPKSMPISSARAISTTLEHEGFELINAPTGVPDFINIGQFNDIYAAETMQLIQRRVSADEVVVTAPGILRFSEAREECGTLNNSRPARFAHVDISDLTASQFNTMNAPKPGWRRCVSYNLWRVISTPPQDVPLALCCAPSVAAQDLVPATAVFDHNGEEQWSFEGITVAYNPNHQWRWYPDMTVEEAILFVTNESDPSRPHSVPHVAFDNPLLNKSDKYEPRASIEIRAMAYWY